MKILPITYPPITCFPQYVAQLAPILHTDSGRLWYYNNFVQIFVKKDPDGKRLIKFRDDFFILKGPYTYYNYPFLARYDEISNYKHYAQPTDMVNVVKRLLDDDKYIIINIDWHYLNSNKPLGFVHDTYIYGYDDDTQTFQCLDFPSFSGKLEKFNLDYQGFIQSCLANYETIPDHAIFQNHMISYGISSYDYQFDLKLFQKLISDYYHGTNSVDSYELLQTLDESDHEFWGIKCYQFLINEVTAGNLLDKRSLCLIRDQKISMIDSLEYLITLGKPEKDCKELINGFRILEENLNQSINLSLKQAVRYTENVAEKLKLLFEEAVEQENKLFGQLISLLDS